MSYEFRISLCRITNNRVCIQAHSPAEIQKQLEEEAGKKHGVNY